MRQRFDLCRITKQEISANAEKDTQIYAPDTACPARRAAAGPCAALRPRGPEPGPAPGGRLCIPRPRDGFVGRAHPPRLPAAADGRQHPAGRQIRHAPALRQTLARCGPVAAGPERGRHPGLRIGTPRRPLQGLAGGHGHAHRRRGTLPENSQSRPFVPDGRHRPDCPLRRGHPAGPDRSRPHGEDGQHRRPAVDNRRRTTLGDRPGFRDANLARRLRTLRPAGRRHSGHMPGATRQPAGPRAKRPAQPGRLFLPDGVRRVRRNTRRDNGSGVRSTIHAVDRPGRQHCPDRQQRRIRPTAPPSRRRIRPGVHRRRAARPHRRLGLQPGCGHRPTDPPDSLHRTLRALGPRPDRKHRHGRCGHLPLRRRPANRPFPNPGRPLRWTRHPENGAGFTARRQPFGRPEYERRKTPLSGGNPARAQRPGRPDDLHRDRDAGRHCKNTTRRFVARTYRPAGGRSGKERARPRPDGSLGPFRGKFHGSLVPEGIAARLGPAPPCGNPPTNPAPRIGGSRQGCILGRIDTLGRRRRTGPERTPRPPQANLRRRTAV